MRKHDALLFVVSAPSGAGKTTLCREMSKRVRDLYYSVSWTTRLPRPTEVHGQDYFFTTKEEFQRLIERSELAEWAEVHGNLYGTHAGFMEQKIEKGMDVIVDVDAQGASLLKKRFPDGVFIYILPPSLEVLKGRLYDRGSDDPGEIERRLKEARNEIQDLDHYSYVIVNDQFEQSAQELQSIIMAERVRLRPAQTEWIKKRLLEDKPLTRKEG
jgi:guanylate kinase